METYTDKEIIEYLKNRDEHIICYLKKKYFPLIRLMIMDKGASGSELCPGRFGPAAS